ncbi:MAG: glycosyltransferase family 4 protein [Candidatus Omnitrophica bacterium]|nr:glycosyltransferase family 4 protein [Candidatus Omnitrophota bacterium]
MVNVLYYSCFGALTGGGQRSLLMFLERMDRSRYKPVLVVPEDGELARKAGSLGIETAIESLPPISGVDIFAPFRALGRVKKLIREKEITLVHTDSPRATLYFGIAARGFKIPLIWHVRVSDGEPFIYERVLYGLASGIICVSERAARRFSGFPGLDDKINIIYNGVDVREFSPVHTTVSGHGKREDNSPIFAIIGALSPVKGHDVFIKAAAEVVKEFPGARYSVIGGGTAAEEVAVRKLIGASGLSGKVDMPGHLSDMPAIMNGADIVVNSSRLEGFSRVVIEAMASGKPVIASDAGGNPEAVRDRQTGIIFRSGDIRALAKAMKTLAGDPGLRSSMGREGRKRAEDLFDINRNVKDTENFYEEILKKNIS